MADTSQTRLSYITESTWGTTPATPAFQNVRFTGESLNANRENAVSDEIRADRNVTDLIQVGSSAGGSVDFELSYGSFDDWLESLLYNSWANKSTAASSATTDAAGYSIGATSITLASAGTGAIEAGDAVTFAGDNNEYLVASGDADVSDGGTITLASPGLIQAIPTSATGITVVPNVLKNGNTEKSFTIEKTFEAGTTDQYHRFAGSIASSMSLAIASGEIVTGSFDFLSKGLISGQSIITGATYNNANSNDVINAAADFANLSIAGVTGPQLTSLNLDITNNLRGQRVLGSIENRAVGTGRFEVTGSLTAYFENEEMYDLYLNGTAADLSFKLGGSSSKNYVFNMAKIKFDTGEVVAGGNDEDLVANMTFRALFDGTDNTLEITRTI